MAYPCTTGQVAARVALMPFLAKRPVEDYATAIALARGEIEAALPAAGDGTLSTSADLGAWGICLQLAVWHLRWDSERDAEGNPPEGLRRMREVLAAQLASLAGAESFGAGVMSIAPFEALDAPGLPS